VWREGSGEGRHTCRKFQEVSPGCPVLWPELQGVLSNSRTELRGGRELRARGGGGVALLSRRLTVWLGSGEVECLQQNHLLNRFLL
jgi:hypothetical protein